jgi:hypothetical protein
MLLRRRQMQITLVATSDRNNHAAVAVFGNLVPPPKCRADAS